MMARRLASRLSRRCISLGLSTSTWRGNVADWDGSGDVHEVPAITNGDSSLSFPAQGINRVTFTIPPNLPDGQYLVRLENIALHLAGTWRHRVLHILCPDQRRRRTSDPQPKVAFPGAYTGYEHSILISIYPPHPATYEMSGPVSTLRPL
ncbi:lytic polysaccharide monooxygenase [Sphaerobolus stellatus SS14]|uniref:lytic cellulose monooxygenase (C4-dehydrogenating) n=1 Tax=Sphaerobolus stellatus (strain SS14) TaxID=990650 RepID=A0A0C9V3F2_SPHS4|nr:lytic polysaccharide monooxygenase [Sphaerobolus stellatus SS14]